jgi:transposase, IS30 family
VWGAANSPLHHCFPKGTDLPRWNTDDIRAVAWRTRAEALTDHLHSPHQPGVATSD